ncbi:chitosanase [Mesorhizobium sp. WSM2561]|uniref:chitosanase n=1 Tax=Mesorhizobium sp. WSM2561 TaxID=1040985 RepID=UPI0004AD757B|nr:chitosanase [Mesorhizobium sp. WSM2561]
MPTQSPTSEISVNLEALVAATRALQSTVNELVRLGGSDNELVRAENFAASDGALGLTASQRRICERVINVFETGTVGGKYDAVSIFHDGPNRIRQITYGRSQTTEYSNLRELVQMYVDAGGTFSESLDAYVDLIGRTPLTDNADFKRLLKRAANEDAMMRATQDRFFDRRYFQPAMKWASQNGFQKALSALVIYDSFIHSGGILSFLRQRFAERPPAAGGDEKVWIGEYIQVRHQWLSNHSNPDVRPSNYRTKDLAREIARGNWDLASVPFVANGVAVDASDLSAERLAIAAAIGGQAGFAANASDVVQEWCEAEPLTTADAVFRELSADVELASPAAAAAGAILANPRIRLATVHVSGVVDDAMARDNIMDTAAGRKAKRSNYGSAPGGTVQLDTKMLQALLTLAEEYSFSVSEICGANHSPNSKHYKGVAFDVNVINGQHVRASHPKQQAFRSRCAALGATQVLGPGNNGHDTHIHASWP